MQRGAHFPCEGKAREGPKHFKFARLILPQRAECGHSLRVRGGKTSTARADIQTTVNTEFFLHRRKAALSPLGEFDFLAASACSTKNAAGT